MHPIEGILETFDYDFLILVVGFLIIVGGTFYFFSPLFFAVPIGLFLSTYPFWLPIALSFTFWFFWVDYVQSMYIKKQEHTLLEIFLPRDIYKSPLAMEVAISGLHIEKGASTWYDRYILGKVLPNWSFEIASIEGHLHFYIWCRRGFKDLVEAQFYGQYPGIEIQEVPDYTTAIPYYDRTKMGMWGNEFKFKQPDPYPIRTYVDYGLEKDPKEEFKIDPLTSVLEFMASIGKGEQVWLQIVTRAHRKRHKKGTFWQNATWREEGEELIRQKIKELKQEAQTEEGGWSWSRIPTKGEAEVLAAIDRNTSKLPFSVGMRVVYIAYTPEARDYFAKTRVARVHPLINIMKPFNSFSLNNIQPTSYIDFDYPWEDFRRLREHMLCKRTLARYRLRAFFHAPYKKNNLLMSTEELATIYHFPGGVLQAPTISRVLSKKVEPPGNLPR